MVQDWSLWERSSLALGRGHPFFLQDTRPTKIPPLGLRRTAQSFIQCLLCPEEDIYPLLMESSPCLGLPPEVWTPEITFYFSF